MILQALYALYDRLAEDPSYQIPLFGFSLQKIVFRVVLKPDGTLHAIEDARLRGDKPKPDQRLVPGYSKKSGSGLNPGFLWDTSEYMLGYDPEESNPDRTRKAFESFRERHLEVERQINSPVFSAVCRFLEQWKPEMACQWPILKEVGPGYGVFQIIGQTAYVHDDPIVKEWWIRHLEASDSHAPVMQCLITGRLRPARTTHLKVKSVGKGEALLVSFNDTAYESYGKEQSLNAPVSDEAAFRYVTALNALTDGPMKQKHRFTLGDATVVFWTGKPTMTEDIFAEFLQHGSQLKSEVQDEKVRKDLELFLNALRRGEAAYAELEGDSINTPFYLLGLTAQTRGRIGVRFFYTDRLGTLLNNLRRHCEDMEISQKSGKETPTADFPPLWKILDETAPRQNGKVDREKIPPILEGPLLRSVIAGSPYPAALFSAMIRRIHADGVINEVRAGVIAAFLRRNLKQEISMNLDPERQDPAYRLGRLFAVMERVQEKANPGIKATIRDRFYSSASATPSAVFPRLLRTYHHHLANLEKGNRIFYERLSQEILASVKAFPTHFSLAEQGEFALGYYHQVRDLWTPKEPADREKGE